MKGDERVVPRYIPLKRVKNRHEEVVIQRSEMVGDSRNQVLKFSMKDAESWFQKLGLNTSHLDFSPVPVTLFWGRATAILANILRALESRCSAEDVRNMPF